MLFYRSASEVSAIEYRDCFPSILPTLEIELSGIILLHFSKQAPELFIRQFYEDRERIRDLLSVCSLRLFQTDYTFLLFLKNFLSLKQIRKNRR